MDADLERSLLLQASLELTSGGRLALDDLATALRRDLEEVTAAVEELAGRDLLEVEDGAVVRVTDTGLAEVEVSD